MIYNYYNLLFTLSHELSARLKGAMLFIASKTNVNNGLAIFYLTLFYY